MKTDTFNGFRDLIYEVCGITLGDNKTAMIRARIAKRMRKIGTDDPQAYLEYVINDTSGRELYDLVDSISTNVTDFYREKQHFPVLRKAIRNARDDGMRRLRIWSAACSSGEEPYTIVIETLEELRGAAVDFKLLASDISTRILKKCTEGVYRKDQLKPVPAGLKQKYFRSRRKDGELLFEVKDNVKSLVQVRRINLIEVPYQLKGPLDAIFCRNVMIYFDRPIRAKIIGEFARLLRPGGLLFVGHAETLTAFSSSFVSVGPSIYRLER